MRGGDPALSEYPLGICLARGLISRDLHDDGLLYAGLYARIAAGYGVGRMHGSVQGLWTALASGFPDRAHSDGGGGPGPRRLARFLAARTALAAAGRRPFEAVHQAAVFQRLPAFLLRQGPAEADGLLDLRAGLEALTAHFAGERRGNHRQPWRFSLRVEAPSDESREWP